MSWRARASALAVAVGTGAAALAAGLPGVPPNDATICTTRPFSPAPQQRQVHCAWREGLADETHPPARHFDVVVLGGGVVGSSTAYHVAKAQLARGGDASVALLEKQACGSGATGLSAGTLWNGGAGHGDDTIAGLCHGTVGVLKEIEAMGFACDLRLPGSLTIATSPEEVSLLRGKYEAQRAAGFDVSYLGSPSAVAAAEPALGPEVRAAILTPGSGHVDPGKTAGALAEAAASLGAVVREGAEVVSVARLPVDADAPSRDAEPPLGGGARPRFEVATATGEVYHANTVVLAAGTGIQGLAMGLGVRAPAITPVKGHIWTTREPPGTLRHVIFTVFGPVAWAKDPGRRDKEGIPAFCTDNYRIAHTYGRQAVDGTLLFGWGREPCQRGDLATHPTAVAQGYAAVARFLPLLRGRRRQGEWAGIMPFSADGKPIVGPLGDLPGLWIAGGFGPHGIMEGPMAAKWLAYRIVGVTDASVKALPPHTAAALHPDRFVAGA